MAKKVSEELKACIKQNKVIQYTSRMSTHAAFVSLAMAYNEHLAERITKVLKEKRVRFEAKKMMGGLCFMVKGKMCLGIEKDKLMARIEPEFYEAALKKKGCHEMDFTGRPMKGFVFVDPNGIDMDKDLEYWVQLCLDFNPKAKSSKKK